MFDFIFKFFKKKEEPLELTNLISKGPIKESNIDNNKENKITKKKNRPVTRTGVLGVSYYWKFTATGRRVIGFSVSIGRNGRREYFGFHKYGEEGAWIEAVKYRYMLEGKTKYTIPKMPDISKVK